MVSLTVKYPFFYNSPKSCPAICLKKISPKIQAYDDIGNHDASHLVMIPAVRG